MQGDWRDWAPRVPDLSRPPGAEIDGEGFVRCVQCGARVDVMSADVVGEGYQCATCTALAPPPDAYAYLAPAGQLAIGGVVLAIAAVVMWIARIGDGPIHGHALPLPIAVGSMSAGCFLMAYVRWRKL